MTSLVWDVASLWRAGAVRRVRHGSRTRDLREVFGLSVVIVSPSGVPMHVEGSLQCFHVFTWKPVYVCVSLSRRSR